MDPLTWAPWETLSILKVFLRSICLPVQKTACSYTHTALTHARTHTHRSSTASPGGSESRFRLQRPSHRPAATSSWEQILLVRTDSRVWGQPIKGEGRGFLCERSSCSCERKITKLSKRIQTEQLEKVFLYRSLAKTGGRPCCCSDLGVWFSVC